MSHLPIVNFTDYVRKSRVNTKILKTKGGVKMRKVQRYKWNSDEKVLH